MQVVVVVLSLGFIGFVTLLHVVGKVNGLSHQRVAMRGCGLRLDPRSLNKRWTIRIIVATMLRKSDQLYVDMHRYRLRSCQNLKTAVCQR